MAKDGRGRRIKALGIGKVEIEEDIPANKDRVYTSDPTYDQMNEYINMRLGPAQADFHEVWRRMNAQLGYQVPKAQVLRHCISFTNQHYLNPIGIR